jgi:hypothetical protein
VSVTRAIGNAGNRVRVTAQLIDAKTEDHPGSQVYERDLADVFVIQADIATDIATALKAGLSSAEQQRVERPLTAARLCAQIESLPKTRRVASAVRVFGHLGTRDEQ